jgi:hypothetical protein
MPEAERRRIGKVVHDDRGNASVSWRDAPLDQQRQIRDDGRRPIGGTSRTDLRRLSEHIKMMRDLEARKRNGDD